MPNVLHGKPYEIAAAQIAIVVSRYNETITGKLLQGALDTLIEAGIADQDIDVVWVPGAWELPLMAELLATSARYEAVICLGAVIRGETTHDQHINRTVGLTLGELAMRSKLPIVFGLLTCETMEQAIHRSGGNVGNKGVECAEAGLEMVTLRRRLGQLGK